jgi:Sulfotransferase domain
MKNSTSDKIDFFVIGAQKAGTTSLHFYLNNFRDITLPTVKESPFFSRPSSNSNYDHFFSDAYQNIKTNSIIGKVTPQYSCYLSTAQNIHKYNSNAKIILIARNPINRAYSHYMMNKRREIENLSFEERVLTILENGSAFDVSETTINDISYDTKYELNKILSWGCYGEILQAYSEYFLSNSVLIINSDELENNTPNAIHKIRKFLDLPTIPCQDFIYKKYHVGGEKTKLPRIETLMKIPAMQRIKSYIPRSLRHHKIIESLRFNYDVWNVEHSSKKQIPLSSGIHKDLVKFYKADINKYLGLEKYLSTWFREVDNSNLANSNLLANLNLRYNTFSKLLEVEA